MAAQNNNFDGSNRPPPPPPPPPGAPPPSSQQERQGISPEPEPAQAPEIVPEGQGQWFQPPPPAPSPSPFGEDVYAEPVTDEWGDVVDEAKAEEEIGPVEEKVKMEPITLETDPALASAEIIHERKALTDEYLAPSLDDEKAIFNAMLKEIKGIREEMEGLNQAIAALVKKLEGKL